MRLPAPALIAALTLACNQPPEGLAVQIGPESPGTLDDLDATALSPATDPNGHAVELIHAWTVDGEPADVGGDTVPADLTEKGQVWEVTVTPFDGRANGPAATAQVTISNTLPTATVSLSPEDPRLDDALIATPSASDADNDAVQITYEWFVDGTKVQGRSERIPSERTERGQVWEVVVTPSDDEGDGEPARASVTIGNSPPSVFAAAVDPARPSRADTVACLGGGWQDPDGDAEDYQVSWSVDGTQVAESNTLDLAPHPRGSTVSCTLTPFDGVDTGEPVTSDPVTVVNAPPSLADVSIEPAAPRVGTPLVATPGELADLDDDAVELEYLWTVDGVESGTTAELPGTRFVGGQEVVLTVTPHDGTDAGEPVTASVVIGNSPPVVTEVLLSPASPDTDDDVVATVTARDPDGEAFTLDYAWTVDGTALSVTGDTLAGDTWFDKHDPISVTVTASDDTESGTPLTSDTLYAINTPPPAPELVFSPAEPTDVEDVQCVIDAQDPDLDGDSITYTFAWTRNGTAFTSATTTTHTGDTVAASDRSEDDEWECTVTPHDGEDNGPDASRVLAPSAPSSVGTDGSPIATPLRGGSMAGTIYLDDCPSGQVLVGVSADLTSSGGYFAELATRCAPLTLSSCTSSSCTVGHGTVTTGTWRGGSGSFMVTRDCPSGQVVAGFVGRAGWYLDQLTLRCRPISVSFDGADWKISVGSTYTDLSPVGGSGGGAFSRSDCPSGEVATRGNFRAASSQVDGFGLACDGLDLAFP